MKVLVACEFSQIVTKAFRARGHEAYSCDILPTEWNPDWHIQDDVLKHLDDGWDLMIAHPPCTYLSSAGLHWNHKRPEREQKTVDAFNFFKILMNAKINKIAIENPVGYINTHWGPATQIINPCNFGEPYIKKTCLWLKNLPKLSYFLNDSDFGKNLIVKPTHYYICSGSNYREGAKLLTDKSQRDPHERSRTFQGIAEAMAEQWG